MLLLSHNIISEGQDNYLPQNLYYNFFYVKKITQ